MLQRAHNGRVTRAGRLASFETYGRKDLEHDIRADVGHEQHRDAEDNERSDGDERSGDPR